MTDNQVEAVIADAFSRTAEKYDQFGDNHPHLDRIRKKVYQHVLNMIPTGSSILELNSGTGTDATSLVQHGYRVHATDIAPGMLERVAQKAEHFDIAERLTWQSCSFLELEQVNHAPFDAVFSNFGGLNCVPSLTPVIEKLPLVLRPDGIVTWVIMPPICLWELALVFTGQFRLAVRRLSSNGIIAHLEGLYFPVYYFTPAQVIKAFGADYELLAVEGLSVITPTTESKNFYTRFPRLYQSLAWLDDRLSPHKPFSEWGDFFIISLRYRPQK